MSFKSSNRGDVAKVQIYANANEIDDFTEFFQKLGMSQREAGTRLFDWFNRQSPLIRQQILQPMPEEVAPDIARIVLERMAEKDRLRQPQTPQTKSTEDDEAAKACGAPSLTVYNNHPPVPQAQA